MVLYLGVIVVVLRGKSNTCGLVLCFQRHAFGHLAQLGAPPHGLCGGCGYKERETRSHVVAPLVLVVHSKLRREQVKFHGALSLSKCV